MGCVMVIIFQYIVGIETSDAQLPRLQLEIRILLYSSLSHLLKLDILVF